MGCVWTRCDGLKDRKTWSIPEKKGEGSTPPAQQRRANVILYHRRKGRLQITLAGPEEAALNLVRRAEGHYRPSHLQKHSEDIYGNGKISADTPSQSNGEVYMIPSSDLGEIWNRSGSKITKEDWSRNKASVKTSVAEAASISGSTPEKREEPGFEISPLAWKYSEEASNSKRGSVSLDTEQESPSCSDYGFSRPADFTNNTLRPLDRRYISSDDVLPIHDHDMLWEVLGARPGWKRDVHEGTRGTTVKGFVEYQIRTAKTKKTLATYRLPWPELFAASTDSLSSFVEMVNRCTGSEIFELRISNDRPLHLKPNLVDNARAATKPPRVRPENGTDRHGSYGDCLRNTMDGSPKNGIIATSMLRSLSPVQDVHLDCVDGRTPTGDHIRTAAKGQPARRPSQGPGTPTSGPIREADGGQPVRTAPDPRSCISTSTGPPDLFANVRKAGLRPPPVFFRGITPVLQPSSGFGRAAAADTTLFTSAPPQIRNDFDSESALSPRQEVVTFTAPYQSPYRGPTSTYIRKEYSNLADRKHLLRQDFLAPVMGTKFRLTL